MRETAKKKIPTDPLNDLLAAAKPETLINRDWPTDHARRIYRKLGDRKKYLELRHKKLAYGMDYHDLASFH